MCIRDRPGRSVTPANRDRVRAALVSAHLRDLAVASRSGDGEREGAAGPRLDHNHGRHLRQPDHRGRQGDLGGCRLVHRKRGSVVSASTERSARTWPGLLEKLMAVVRTCLLYTSDAADDLTRVDLGGRRIIK